MIKLGGVLPYYTLKQAVADLNSASGRADIDESYLIHLAASGKVKLSIPAVTVTLRPYCLYSDAGTMVERLYRLGLVESIFANDACEIFLNINIRYIRELSKGFIKVKLSCFDDFFIYDSFQIFGQDDKWPTFIWRSHINSVINSSSGYMSDAELEHVVVEAIDSGIKKYISKIKHSMYWEASLPGELLEIGLISKDFREFQPFHFGVDLVEPSKVSEDYFLENRKSVELGVDDLFIVEPELQRIIKGHFRDVSCKAKSSTLKKKTSGMEVGTKTSRMAEAVLWACEQLDNVNPRSLRKYDPKKPDIQSDRAKIKEKLSEHPDYKDLVENDNSFRTEFTKLGKAGIICEVIKK